MSQPPPAAPESPLQRATRDFEAAVAANDYARAVEAAFGSNVADIANGDMMSRAILAKNLPTAAAAVAHLRNIVFWGDPIPPALALYVADLLEGKNLGRRRKTPKEIASDDIDLLVLIGELAEPFLNAGMSKTAALKAACERCSELFPQVRSGSVPGDVASRDALVRLAAKTSGYSTQESIMRAYHRAAARRSEQARVHPNKTP